MPAESDDQPPLITLSIVAAAPNATRIAERNAHEHEWASESRVWLSTPAEGPARLSDIARQQDGGTGAPARAGAAQLGSSGPVIR